jgi:hypothetical protein
MDNPYMFFFENPHDFVTFIRHFTESWFIINIDKNVSSRNVIP